VTGAAGGGGGTGGGGRAATSRAAIQLPQVTGTQINTTVTVPDQGTILLGGQRLVTELENRGWAAAAPLEGAGGQPLLHQPHQLQGPRRRSSC
jgi:hypothetical protein